jgi:hypothetical protein
MAWALLAAAIAPEITGTVPLPAYPNGAARWGWSSVAGFVAP